MLHHSQTNILIVYVIDSREAANVIVIKNRERSGDEAKITLSQISFSCFIPECKFCMY